MKNKKGEYYWANLNAVPFIYCGNKDVILTIKEDITERKRIEQTRNEFISMASHELRTPLTTMNWYSEMLLSDNKNNFDSQQKEFLREIYESNRELAKLVDILLNTSTIELGIFSIMPEPTNIASIVQDVFEDFTFQIKDKKLSIRKN